ncbi:MAG: hypothetical protein U5O69_10315 [Candidatus Competibacteraceae bacterium]|nr:hypothetical protein [Candidatus Competibacteraceae bacterium]
MTVDKTGAGGGAIASSPGGHRLRQAPGAAADSPHRDHPHRHAGRVPPSPASWSGACAWTGDCTVTMDAAKAVTATFEPAAPYPLTLATAGTGSGTVGGGGSYGAGAPVTLTAAPAAGSSFTGGAEPCAASFAMPAEALTCTATFALLSITLSATAGAGGGIDPAERTVAHGATTTFTVTPQTGHSIGAVEGRPAGNAERYDLHHRPHRRPLHRERHLHPRQPPR